MRKQCWHQNWQTIIHGGSITIRLNYGKRGEKFLAWRGGQLSVKVGLGLQPANICAWPCCWRLGSRAVEREGGREAACLLGPLPAPALPAASPAAACGPPLYGPSIYSIRLASDFGLGDLEGIVVVHTLQPPPARCEGTSQGELS